MNILYITDFDNAGKITPIARQFMPMLFQKTIDLGDTAIGKRDGLGNIYLGLTTQGKLYTFWLNQKNSIEYRFAKMC